MAEIETITQPEVEARIVQVPGPVALDFYQASCPPCRALEPRLEHIVQEYHGRVPVYRVDIDRDVAVAERFGVKSVPTVLVFRGGKEVQRLNGLITDSQVRQAFDGALTGSRT